MADIRPFRAWRYNLDLQRSIDQLTSPLFDVVSDKQREALYRNPLNSIHLSVPQPPNAADRAAITLNEWKKSGVLVQDQLPAIYVYYQHFRLPGSTRTLIRKGLILNIRVHDWNEGVVLRHENTIPTAVNDRIELLEKTKLHVSPTHGLYTDPDFLLEPMMDAAMATPIAETEDYQGVRDQLGVIHDARLIRRIQDVLQDKTIILADGHHRYESSIAYQKKMNEANPSSTGEEGYHFHLMMLTNTEADDLRILPTHRLISGIPDLSESHVLSILEKYFVVREVEDPDTLPEIILGKPWAFGLIFANSSYKLRLKPDAFEHFHWPFPDEIKRLDLTVMHHFIIEKALGIPGKEQRASTHISFDRSFPDCLTRVIRGQAQLAIITQEVSINDIKRVCASGYTMPQKSTYFYPKAICGLLFSSIQQNEFQLPPYAPFNS